MLQHPPTDIIIPTCKPCEGVGPLLREVCVQSRGPFRVFATCTSWSAAVNRNIGLRWAEADVVLMIDDDVRDLPEGWNVDLAYVLLEHPECVMVSARLLHPNKTPAQMLGDPVDEPGKRIVCPRRELPTACVAFRNDGTRFDEGYVGSGWEDTDFAARLRGIYPSGTFMVHGGVRVVHINEQKQQSSHFAANKARYTAMWGRHPGYEDQE